MSLTLKRVFMALFGLLGALVAWPALSALRFLQPRFPGYLAFTLAQGAAAGLAFGAMLGSIEGVVVSSRAKALRGLGFGALYGALAGAAGAAAGQLALFVAGATLFKSASTRLGPALALSNGVAWAIIGLAIALTEGLRARSPRKLAAGLAGGAVGGLLGGAVLSALSYARPDDGAALLAGLAIFGLAIGSSYAAFENRFSFGALKLLNGPLKNKEYLLASKRLTLGSDDTCDVVLKGYPGVAPLHAVIRAGKEGARLEAGPDAPRVSVNDEPLGDRPLRQEDVIAIGKAKFIYGYFG